MIDFKIPKHFYHFGSWVDYLNKLKEQSNAAQNERDRIEILRQKARIITSLLAGSVAIVFCLLVLFWFGNIILKEDRNQKGQNTPSDINKIAENQDIQDTAKFEQFVQDNIRIYSRVISKSPLIYALAKDISEGKNTPEEKIFATFLYLHENVSRMRDDLPKPIFFFPEETIEERKGNSSEIAILAGAILYNMGINSELVECDDRMGVRFRDLDINAYRVAMKRFLPQRIALFSEKASISQNFPIKMELPDKLASLSLLIDVDANKPLDILLIGRNETSSHKDNSFIGIKNGSFKIQYQLGSVLLISTKAPKNVELEITVMIERDHLSSLLTGAAEENRIAIYYDFGGNLVASLTGINPYLGKQIKIFPPIP